MPQSSTVDVVQDLDFADAGIDRDHNSVRRIAEGASVTLRLKSDRGLKTTAIDIRRQFLRAQIPGFGNLTQRDRFLRPDDHAAVSYVTVSTARLHQMGADRDEARQQFLAGVCHRTADITMLRDA